MKNPSAFQKAIFEWIKNGKGNAMVEAKAGSGKTSTAVAGMNEIPATKRVLFLAFNKTIAEELKRKAPKHADCMTLNSLGGRAWADFLGKWPVVNKGKTLLAMQEVMTEIEFRKYGTAVKKLTALAKHQGLVPSTVKHARSLVPDTREAWISLMDHHDIEPTSQDDFDRRNGAPTEADYDAVISLTRRVLHVSCEHPEVIDFDDQLYLTVVFGARPRARYDWIFVDEAQDLSPIQHAMVERVMTSTSRVVIIGDTNQAIYGFRGADSESMKNFSAKLNATALPLSICYRCPKSHIRLAQKWVPDIEAAPDAIEGEVMDLGEEWDAKLFRNTDLIICRNGAPLVKAAYRILAQGVAVRIMGRDIGEGLVTLIKKLKARTTDELIEKLDAWQEKQIERAKKKDKDANTDTITDKSETIRVFIDMFPSMSPVQLCAKIESIYANENECEGILTLSSVHRAKGLEAERVFILNEFLMPSRQAKKPWQQEQEKNLLYIAHTRAKHTLGFIEINMNKDKEK